MTRHTRSPAVAVKVFRICFVAASRTSSAARPSPRRADGRRRPDRLGLHGPLRRPVNEHGQVYSRCDPRLVFSGDLYPAAADGPIVPSGGTRWRRRTFCNWGSGRLARGRSRCFGASVGVKPAVTSGGRAGRRRGRRRRAGRAVARSASRRAGTATSRAASSACGDRRRRGRGRGLSTRGASAVPA